MTTNIGIGFVTGRKLFKKVLKTYINNWLEHGLIENQKVRLHLFVAYDLKYQQTQANDYKNISPELEDMIESIQYYSEERINAEVALLESENVLNATESKLIFGQGYGRKRNVITYFAIKHKMDKLLFIDDDEFPMAAVKNVQGRLQWMGQSILGTHLKYNDNAAITHGHHCGYISPIPYISFNDVLTENDFKQFIDAISNDIISWDKIRHLILNNKGVTYADPNIVDSMSAYEVEEENGMKFISGANLCFNLQHCRALPPFYNPPGARGEDTFMSTALSQLKVMKVPCYTFHDGFSMYNHILSGVLPIHLEAIETVSAAILKRFVNAAIGWIRYKPLLVYVTNPGQYEAIMEGIQQRLAITIPKLCAYFKTDDFNKINAEFARYRNNVKKHFQEFEQTKLVWRKLMNNMSAVPLDEVPNLFQLQGQQQFGTDMVAN